MLTLEEPLELPPRKEFTKEQAQALHDLDTLHNAPEPPLQRLSLQQENYDRAKRNLLPQKVHSNSVGALYYRADYELRWLRVAKRCRVRWEKEFLKASDAGDIAAMATASKELREWCERERALLRIARPAAENVRKPKSVHRLDRDTTATVVETEPVPPGPQA